MLDSGRRILRARSGRRLVEAHATVRTSLWLSYPKNPGIDGGLTLRTLQAHADMQPAEECCASGNNQDECHGPLKPPGTGQCKRHQEQHQTANAQRESLVHAPPDSLPNGLPERCPGGNPDYPVDHSRRDQDFKEFRRRPREATDEVVPYSHRHSLLLYRRRWAWANRDEAARLYDNSGPDRP
jgi:hypothetical protein